MKQYTDLLQRIIDEGRLKPSSRPNLPPTFCLTGANIRMDLREGFPMLTTKRIYVAGVVHELLWFLRGATNIKYLVDNKVNIWNKDAYRWYEKYCKDIDYPEVMTIDEFVSTIKSANTEVSLASWFGIDIDYTLGDLGKVYGYQWRDRDGIDQIANIVKSLQTEPYSRYHILDAWNPKDRPEMALPPCHLLYEFVVVPLDFEELWNIVEQEHRKRSTVILSETCQDFDHLQSLAKLYDLPINRLDMVMFQRSCDTALGLPFNLASMSLLQHIMAKVANMVPGYSSWTGGDVHLYEPHIDTAKIQIAREPLKLCNLEIAKDLKTLEDILSLDVADFKFTDYVHHDKLDYELFAG